MPEQPQPFAIVHDYRQLVAALRTRVAELGVKMESLDAVSGFPDRYFSKLICPAPLKHIGNASLGPMLTVLGLELHVVVDHESFAKIAHRLSPRTDHGRHKGLLALRKPAPRNGRNSQDWTGNSQWGKTLNARWQLKTSPEQRSRIACEAAIARWKRAAG